MSSDDDGPPLLAPVEPLDSASSDKTLCHSSSPVVMPALLKVTVGDPTSSDASMSPNVGFELPEENGYQEKDPAINREAQLVMVAKQNGKVPLARDTDMSLLKLAYKLKQAQKKYPSKNGTTPKQTDLSSKAITQNCDEKSLMKSVIQLKKFQTNSPVKNFHSPRGAQISLLKPIPLRYKLEAKQNIQVPISEESVIPSNAVAEERTVQPEVKPIEMPKLPKDAIQLLTSIKFQSSDDPKWTLPESTGLPLWPVFSATRDGGAKMDMKFLDKYLPEHAGPHPVQPPGASAACQGSVQQEEQCAERDPNISDSVEMKDPVSDAGDKVSLTVPKNLDDDSYQAIEDLAFDTVSRQHLQRAARKAIDITKAVIYTTRKSALQSYTAIKPKQTPPKAVCVTTTKPNGGSPFVIFNASSLLLQKLATKASPGGGEQGPAKPIPVTRQEISHDVKEALLNGTATVVQAGATTPKPPVVAAAGGIIPRKYQCQKCKYQTDNRSHLRRHESSVHAGTKLYRCYICSIEFARSEKCRAHVTKEHPEVTYDPRLIRKDRTLFGASTKSSPAQKVSPLNASDVKPQIPSVLENGEFSGQVEGQNTSTPVKQGVDPESGGEESFAFNTSMNNSTMADDADKSELNTPKQSDCEDSRQGSPQPGADRATPSGDNGSSSPPPASVLDDAASQSSPAPPAPARFGCSYCSYAGKDAWHLKRHVQDVHNNRKAYQCKMCSYVTSRKHRLISHMKGHGTLACLYCDFSSPDYDFFISHLKVCSDVQKIGGLTCRVCQHAFYNRKLLSDHMWGIHGIRLYVCDMCYYSTDTEAEFEQHNVEQHLIGPEVSDRKCSKCGAAFKVERQYEHHMMSAHRSDVDFDVDGTFLEEKDGSYICLMCSFETKEKDVITAHIEHHKTKWYKCDVPDCSFVAATKKALNKHKASDHLDLMQAAPYTKAAPTADSSMIYDQETGGLQGHGSGMWQCHICPDKTLYRYRRSYEKHMAKHKGYVEPSIEVQSHRAMPAFPFSHDPGTIACLMCGTQGFGDRAELQSHLLRTHGIDAFDHAPEGGDSSDSSQPQASAHSPKMSDAHMEMLRQIAVNATSPVHMSGPVVWPEPEQASDVDSVTSSKSDVKSMTLNSRPSTSQERYMTSSDGRDMSLDNRVTTQKRVASDSDEDDVNLPLRWEGSAAKRLKTE